MAKFADFSGQRTRESLDCSAQNVIHYLRSMLKAQKPAWQRLQAARALEMYQRLVNRLPTGEFQPIIDKLEAFSRDEQGETTQEKSKQRQNSGTEEDFDFSYLSRGGR